MAGLAPKSVQERFPSSVGETDAQAVRATKTAEAMVPTGGVATPAK
jgi:hypothetical protein